MTAITAITMADGNTYLGADSKVTKINGEFRNDYKVIIKSPIMVGCAGARGYLYAIESLLSSMNLDINFDHDDVANRISQVAILYQPPPDLPVYEFLVCSKGKISIVTNSPHNILVTLSNKNDYSIGMNGGMRRAWLSSTTKTNPIEILEGALSFAEALNPEVVGKPFRYYMNGSEIQ